MRTNTLNVALFVLTTIFFSTATYAQDQVKTIYWSEQPSCGDKTSNVLNRENISCELQNEADKSYARIKHGDLMITVRFLVWGRYFIAEPRIFNSSNTVRHLNIKAWALSNFRNEASFKAKEDPLSKTNPLKPPTVISRAELDDRVNRMKQDRQADTLMADLDKTQVVSSDGQRRQIATDPNAKASAIERSANASAMSKPKSKTILQPLKKNEVEANQEAYGRVYFALEYVSDFRLVELRIEDTVYIFPIQTERKVKGF